jgi:hypothetical protein
MGPTWKTFYIRKRAEKPLKPIGRPIEKLSYFLIGINSFRT